MGWLCISLEQIKVLNLFLFFFDADVTLRSDGDLADMLKVVCCGSNFMRNLSITDIRESEKKFRSRTSASEEHNWILDNASAHVASSEGELSRNAKYVV